MVLLILLAVLSLLVHSRPSVPRDPGQRALAVEPVWVVNLPTAIGGPPLGAVAGGHGREYQYRPQTSLYFLDNQTLLAGFVVRSGSHPRLSTRDGATDLPLRLKVGFFNVGSGKTKTVSDWPVESRWASVLAARDTKILALTGDRMTVYSADGLNKITTVDLPPTEFTYLPSAVHVSPTGKNVLLVAGS